MNDSSTIPVGIAARTTAVPAGVDAGGPPSVPFALSVGITGHRSEALGKDGGQALGSRLSDALRLIADCAAKLRADHADCFSPDRPAFRLVSALADGADQIAAEAALGLEYGLQTVLPFDCPAYRASLQADGDSTRFDRLIERSDCVLELPGNPGDPLEAYVMTGRAIVAHCDLLIAVWDGLSPRGRGGTAEVVDLAIERGTPVIHLPVDVNQPARLLWAAFDPVVETRGADPMAERPFDRNHLDQLLSVLLLLPPDPQEREFARIFRSERGDKMKGRIEYHLLLAAAGIASVKRSKRKLGESFIRNREEWREFRETCAAPHQIHASLDLIENAYAWSDRLATHFAQTYRSGHIFNFVLGSFAVCLGLSGFMAPRFKLEVSFVEFFITLAVIINTVIGRRNEWHRRWLDYRQLAERLRPMRSLKLLSLAAPDPPGTATNPVPRRWIDWYACGVWRAMGCPSGTMTPARAASLGAAVAEYEILPQVEYHRRHAHEIEVLDERLERIATLLFFATLIVTVGTVVSLAIAPKLVTEFNNWSTLISAGFPALGTAIFGIRFQGDFGGSARRSLATAAALEQIGNELKRDVTLTRAADLSEEAARRMLADLDEWRLANQAQDLSV